MLYSCWEERLMNFIEMLVLFDDRGQFAGQNIPDDPLIPFRFLQDF